MHKDSKDSRKETMSATAKLTEAITNLRDEIRHMSTDNKKRDDRLDKCETRLDCLEHDVTVIQKDIEHYHDKKG